MANLSTENLSILAQATSLLQQLYPHRQTPQPTDASSSPQSSSSSGTFVSGATALSGDTMSVLLSAQSVGQQQNSSDASFSSGSSDNPSFDTWFSSIDRDGDGSITKAEFEAARPQGTSAEQARALFASIDSSNTGSVTKDQLASALSSASGPQGVSPQASITRDTVALSDGSTTAVTTAPASGLYEKAMGEISGELQDLRSLFG
jgi:hypothetical protein